MLRWPTAPEVNSGAVLSLRRERRSSPAAVDDQVRGPELRFRIVEQSRKEARGFLGETELDQILDDDGRVDDDGAGDLRCALEQLAQISRLQIY